MSYKPFLIAPYKTGLELGVPSWMIPQDAFTELQDCFCYRGVVRKRGGKTLFSDLGSGLPVVGMHNYVNSGGSQTAMAFDTRRAYAHNGTDFVDISLADMFTGTIANPFWACNWLNKSYLCNGKDQIYTYDGVDLEPFDIHLSVGTNDVGFAKIILPYKGHLLLLHTQELGNLQPQRMRWCYPGNPGSWPANNYVDADTHEFIVGAAILRGDLVVFFEKSIWVVKYTGDSRLPFVWQRLAGEGGISQNCIIEHDNQLLALSPTTLIGFDGSRVVRLADKIPDFVFQANQGLLTLANAGVNDALRMLFISYPEADYEVPNKSLLVNYDDFSCSYSTLAFTCWGSFLTQAPDITWDTAGELTWDEAERVWDERSLQAGFLLQLVGDDQGLIWALNETDMTDGGEPIPFLATTGWFNPFIQEGQKARLGFADFLVTRNPDLTIKVDLSIDQNTATYVSEDVICDGPEGADKVWVRVYSGEVGNAHRIRLSQVGDERVELHAMMLWFAPAGDVHA